MNGTTSALRRRREHGSEFTHYACRTKKKHPRPQVCREGRHSSPESDLWEHLLIARQHLAKPLQVVWRSQRPHHREHQPKVALLEAPSVASEAAAVRLHLRNPQRLELHTSDLLRLPSLHCALQQAHKQSLHSILVIQLLAIQTHPKAWTAVRVRCDVHVRGRATPGARHVSQDQREAWALEAQARLAEAADAELLTHVLPQLDHLIAQPLLQLHNLSQRAQELDLDRAWGDLPSRHLGEAP